MDNINTIHPSETSIPENYLAALDIGSNSFHFVFARLVDDNLQILHKEKYSVHLAQGLNDEFILDDDAIARGVETLEKLASTTHNLTRDNFRVVATYTLRKAKNAEAFLKAAAEVFPFEIEVVSGHEEARLIYQGVAHYTAPNGKRLVIDIGGGSTECILGEDEKIFTLASLTMGCVSYQKQFFPKGHITHKAFKKTISAASTEIHSILKRFNKIGWDTCIGTSGTIKSIYNIINTNKTAADPVTLKQLHQLKEQLISFEHFDQIKLDGLKENRLQIICSGLGILIALFETLDIKDLSFGEYALREGVLSEQFELIYHGDVRQKSVNSLSTRFSIDIEQSDKVCALALTLYRSACDTWKIADEQYKLILLWAAQLHEVGNDINPSGYHKHGEYIITHADIAGFNTEKQTVLAWLIGNHRKKVTLPNELNLNHFKYPKLIKVCALLRLSVLLCQQRQLSEDAPLKIKTSTDGLDIKLPEAWLIERPLIYAALESEQKIMAYIGITLSIITS